MARGPRACDLPSDVTAGEQDVEAAEVGRQVRVWWDDTPIDVFPSPPDT